MKLKLADYLKITDAELAADEFFQQWVLFPEKDNDAFWKNFLAVYPDQQSKVLAARQLLESLEDSLRNEKANFLSKEEKTQLKQDIFQTLQFPLEEQTPPIKKWQFARIAAVIFAVIAIPVYFLIKQPKGQDLLVEKTGTKETREILLPDSSIVILNGNSVLKYPSAFLKASTRSVYLEGNAYFKVKKMADKKPFEVHAQSVSISVLGTQFNVNARSKAMEIVLTSGKVKVQARWNDRRYFDGTG